MKRIYHSPVLMTVSLQKQSMLLAGSTGGQNNQFIFDIENDNEPSSSSGDGWNWSNEGFGDDDKDR